MDLSVPGTDRAFRDAARSVAELCVNVRFTEERREQVEIAVAEALSNGLIHGNRGRADVPLRLRARIEGSSVVVRIRDSGPGLKRMPKRPSLQRKLEGKEDPGHWGIFLMCAYASAVDFLVHPRGGHTVRLVFDRDPPDSPAPPRILKEADVT